MNKYYIEKKFYYKSKKFLNVTLKILSISSILNVAYNKNSKICIFKNNK